jgi:glycosyltransferase involved in cell wall biosynthesis
MGIAKIRRRYRRFMDDPRENALRMLRKTRRYVREFAGNPAWFEANMASGTVLSLEPMIIYATIGYPDPTAQMRAFATRAPKGPIVFILYMSWALEPGWWTGQILKEIRRFREAYPQHRVVFTVNESAEMAALAAFDEPAWLLNQNLMISEAHFFPVEGTEIVFDAIYNARFSLQKRVDLAGSIERVAYITRYAAFDGPVEEVKARYEQVRSLEPRHVILNRFADGLPVPLSASDVNQAYSQAAVGLCLSPIEGAMLASVEYLLAGLPIVSVPNVGGRDFYFDPEYCLTVDPDPRAVRDAVNMLRQRHIPRSYIRQRTLDRIAPQRESFLALLNHEIERAGLPSRFSQGWPWQDRRNLIAWATIEDHFQAARAAELLRPVSVHSQQQLQ